MNMHFPYIKGVLILCQHVDKADLAGLLCEAADHIAVGITPPRDCEGNLIPLGVWLSWGQVQVATLWTVNLLCVGNGVNIGARLKISLLINLLHE